MRRARTGMVAAVLVACAGAAPLAAQGGHWSAGCDLDSTTPAGRAHCVRVVEGVEILQPRLGIALSAGNPVQGTASTLGLRLGALPRIGVGLRGSLARAELPGLADGAGGEELSFVLPALAVDASVGLFSGLSLAPTVGGFGAVDLLASLATVPVPEGEGFSDASPISWALGARLGILNESFTAPGLSVSAMYRTIGDVAYGDSTFAAEDAYFSMTDASVLSVRAIASKRLLMLGATAGVGWDRYGSAVDIRVRNPTGGTPLLLREDDLNTDRLTYFGNVSMTFVILHLVGEVGWQEGGSAFTGAVSPELLEQSALYGSLAIRLTL